MLKLTSEELAERIGVPMSVAQPVLVVYRSVGLGVFGACMRFVGMPLEKIALYMNSSQVSTQSKLSPFQQAISLTFKDGVVAPYRVVGPASITAWFLQYSVMGVAFQSFDQMLSQIMGVKPMYYGRELMESPTKTISSIDERYPDTFDYQLRHGLKTLVAPLMASTLESFVSNRAEAQRFFGPTRFAEIEAALYRGGNPTVALKRMAGPAFGANAARNFIMCNTSFVLTPYTYRNFFPQENKSNSTLFWYGLGVNIFVGNVFAITQQALWGRSLDYLRQHGEIRYTSVIREGLRQDGISAFFTAPKWFSRVLMNAPAQGTLPWFYNEVLPFGEPALLKVVRFVLYEEEVLLGIKPEPVKRQATLQRRRSNIASLPTAHPEFREHS